MAHPSKCASPGAKFCNLKILYIPNGCRLRNQETLKYFAKKFRVFLKNKNKNDFVPPTRLGVTYG
jgi:hypothetical protein